MGATINDVAKAAGVSKATVSRFLNDKSRVQAETADRIQRVIESLNYIPNAMARNLALGQGDTIGVLISGLYSTYWNRILGAIHTTISAEPDPQEIFILNCDSILLYNTNKSIQDKIQVLVEQRVAGIVLALRDLQQADVDYLCGQGIPFVVVQSNNMDERVSYVNIDNYKASYDAASHLIGLGHKTIAYVSGPTEAAYATERFEGFRDALVSKRVYQRSMILSGNNSYDDGYWRMKQILSWKQVPTAVMLASDVMAYGAIAALQEAGMSVPGDISLIGFDGLAEEERVYQLLPPLTTVYQPMVQIGEKTAETLLKCIRDKAAGKAGVYRTVLPTRFIDKGSCRRVE